MFLYTVCYLMTDNKFQGTLEWWVLQLMDGVPIPEVDFKTAAALCHHLADLGFLIPKGQDDWQVDLKTDDRGHSINDVLREHLGRLAESEKGMVVRYFIVSPQDLPSEEEIFGKAASEINGGEQGNSSLLKRKTSNLSNLQIVKKYGRQVQSFVELEQFFTSKLVGEHTAAEDIRRIFNFILSRIREKTEPRAWEQLSRRRHK